MVGPLKRALGGFEYIYVSIDKFTKWIEYKPLIKFNATKAVEFMQDIMYRFGMPNRIITDLSSPFTAIEFRSWARDCGISIDYAFVAHLQANGQVERANGLLLAELKPQLFDELKDYGGKWIYELPKKFPKVEQYNEGEADETQKLEIDSAKEVKLNALF
ncbi:uncharacterized protein [Miscanthus floridulus]|uniref:uncharacterized protein n=1 Tax=Miscanthus floridulus TaxID=154761 RepID=UPI00345A56D6